MVRFILIRPGATDFDVQGRIAGNLDIPLNSNGSDQIRRVVHELSGQGIELVYTSPGQAADETAQLLAQSLSLRVKRLDRLRNVDHGLWQGKLIEEVKEKQRKVYRKWQDEPDAVCPPEGEMLISARERIRPAIDKLLKKHKSGVIGLVVPEPLASLIGCCLRHSELADLWQAERKCGEWEAIEVSDSELVASIEPIG